MKVNYLEPVKSNFDTYIFIREDCELDKVTNFPIDEEDVVYCTIEDIVESGTPIDDYSRDMILWGVIKNNKN